MRFHTSNSNRKTIEKIAVLPLTDPMSGITYWLERVRISYVAEDRDGISGVCWCVEKVEPV